jgi:16S rRNA processing protein RimM
LARGEYYWVDLIGCSVFNRDDELLGTVIAMDDHGAHPMLQVQPAVAALDKGIATSARPGSFYIPFVKHFVDRVSIESRRIEVDWLADWS